VKIDLLPDVPEKHRDELVRGWSAIRKLQTRGMIPHSPICIVFSKFSC
jgi:hypothetical protein